MTGYCTVIITKIVYVHDSDSCSSSVWMQIRHLDNWEKVHYVGSRVNIKAVSIVFQYRPRCAEGCSHWTDCPHWQNHSRLPSSPGSFPSFTFNPPLPTSFPASPFQRLIPPHPIAATGKSLEDGAPSVMIFCSAEQWKVHTHSVCPPLPGSIPCFYVNLVKHTSMHLIKD